MQWRGIILIKVTSYSPGSADTICNRHPHEPWACEQKTELASTLLYIPYCIVLNIVLVLRKHNISFYYRLQFQMKKQLSKDNENLGVFGTYFSTLMKKGIW